MFYYYYFYLSENMRELEFSNDVFLFHTVLSLSYLLV